MASNRLRAVNKEEGESAEMDMSPMIDMVFLLLLFFLVVSNPRTIKIDQDVEPPVAKNVTSAETVHGKIVVNIRSDGQFLAEDTDVTFANKELLADYIKEEKEKIEAEGNVPVLHIRADKRVEFKFCQRVIKAGAIAGVKNLAYGALNKSK